MFKCGGIAQALPATTQLTKLRPHWDHAWFVHACALWYNSKLEECIRSCNRALQIRFNVKPLIISAWAMFELGDYSAAVATCSRAFTTRCVYDSVGIEYQEYCHESCFVHVACAIYQGRFDVAERLYEATEENVNRHDEYSQLMTTTRMEAIRLSVLGLLCLKRRDDSKGDRQEAALIYRDTVYNVGRYAFHPHSVNPIVRLFVREAERADVRNWPLEEDEEQHV